MNLRSRGTEDNVPKEERRTITLPEESRKLLSYVGVLLHPDKYCPLQETLASEHNPE